MAGMTSRSWTTAKTSGYCIGSRNAGSGQAHPREHVPHGQVQQGQRGGGGHDEADAQVADGLALALRVQVHALARVDLPRGVARPGDGLLDRRKPHRLGDVQHVGPFGGQVHRHAAHALQAAHHLFDAGHAGGAGHALDRDGDPLGILFRGDPVAGLLHGLGDLLLGEHRLVIFQAQLFRGQVDAGALDPGQLSHDPLHAGRAGSAGHAGNRKLFYFHLAYHPSPPGGGDQ